MDLFSTQLKEQCPDYAHARASSFFFLQKTIELSYSLDKIFFPDRNADGDLLFIFSSNILDFGRSLSSHIITWLAVRRLIAILSLTGPPRDPRTALSARFKNIFSNLKLVSEVNCSKSSNICLICSRPSLKRLKDINKNAISTLWIITKVSQKWYYDFMSLVFQNM